MARDPQLDSRRQALIRQRRQRLGAAVVTLAVLLVILVLSLQESRSPARLPSPPPPAATTKNGDPVPGEPLRPVQSDRYLRLAEDGLADAKRNWWNPEHDWYNDRLDDNDQFPLGTIWTLFGVFEAIDGVAIAQPTDEHKAAVRSFASVAETYYNRSMEGYGPYQGSHTYGDEIWFDDNAWWGLAFVDAYRATGNRQYLDDAALALRFIDKFGWDAAHQRMRWSTRVPNRGSNLETLGGAAALAAELYEYTGGKDYLASARRYVGAMDARATPNSRNGWLFGSPDEHPLTYIEGTMIGAELALCHRGDEHGCAEAWSLATHSFRRWKGRDPFYKPPADTILFRYVLQVAADKRATREALRQHVRVAPGAMYAWARRAASDALRNARIGSLYLKFWDGTQASDHRDGYRRYRSGQLMVHGAPVALFAWLAAVPSLQDRD